MKNKSILLVTVLILIVSTIYLINKIYSKTSKILAPINTLQPSMSQSSVNFKSDLLEFTIQVPAGFSIDEKGNRVTLLNSDKLILINRSSTNFEDMISYLEDLDSKNKVQVIEQVEKRINDYEVAFRQIRYLSGVVEKHYKIFIDQRIYTLSTTDKDLYDDLDQIAQSFEYTP